MKQHDRNDSGKTRRLALKKQTLRALSDAELEQVGGGGRISGGVTAACAGPTWGCWDP